MLTAGVIRRLVLMKSVCFLLFIARFIIIVPPRHTISQRIVTTPSVPHFHVGLAHTVQGVSFYGHVDGVVWQFSRRDLVEPAGMRMVKTKISDFGGKSLTFNSF